MREAIQQFVDREEAREFFRQEASASWEKYRANSMHLTGGETRDWLRTWETEADADAPVCHE